MTALDTDFHVPGWKIEPKYSPKVLIGNWYEERMRTDRSFYDLGYCPTRSDLLPYRSQQHEAASRRSGSANRNDLQNDDKLNHGNDSGTQIELPRISGNYGLKEQMQKKWNSNTCGTNHRGHNTTYTNDFSEWPRRSYMYHLPGLAGSPPNILQATNNGYSHFHTTSYRDSLHVPEGETGDVTSRYSRHMMVL